MEINIKFFGKLAELTGENELTLEVPDETGIKELEGRFTEQYATWNLQTYLVAVNQNITEQQALKNGDEVAFLPPFAGG
ncbi:MAG: MoaD/ThiS family protein [Bacteroidota bacterium]